MRFPHFSPTDNLVIALIAQVEVLILILAAIFILLWVRGKEQAAPPEMPPSQIELETPPLFQEDFPNIIEEQPILVPPDYVVDYQEAETDKWVEFLQGEVQKDLQNSIGKLKKSGKGKDLVFFHVEL
jgi:hypothetical protein